MCGKDCDPTANICDIESGNVRFYRLDPSGMHPMSATTLLQIMFGAYVVFV
jgi:hypothetical protein